MGALGKAATAAGALASAAWRTGTGHTRALAGSREVRGLQTSARRAAKAASDAVHAAGVAAKKRSEAAWKIAVLRGKKAVSSVRKRVRSR